MNYDYRNLLELEVERFSSSWPNHSDTMWCYYDETGQRLRKKRRYWYTEPCPPDTGDPWEGMEAMGQPGGGGTCAYQATSEWLYLYDGGIPLARFHRFDGVIDLFINSPTGRIGSYVENADNKLYFYLTDHIGSTRIVMQAQPAQVAMSYEYEPFGEISSATGSHATPHRFTGKEQDIFKNFDYYYFGARYYDYRVGGFTSIDKAGQFASGYVYGANNPIMGVDPDGNLFFLTTAFLGSAFFSSWMYACQADAAGDFNGWKLLGHAVVGGLSGYAATFGHPNKWLLNVAEGAAQGMVTTGMHNLIDKQPFSQGIGTATGSGAAFGLLTSEHYQNWAGGYGWESNKQALSQIASDDGLVAAADYWAKKHKLPFSKGDLIIVNDQDNLNRGGYTTFSKDHGRLMMHLNKANIMGNGFDADRFIAAFEHELFHFNSGDLSPLGRFTEAEDVIEGRAWNNTLKREPYTHVGRREHWNAYSRVMGYGGTPARFQPPRWWNSRRVYSPGHSLAQASFLLY